MDLCFQQTEAVLEQECGAKLELADWTHIVVGQALETEGPLPYQLMKPFLKSSGQLVLMTSLAAAQPCLVCVRLLHVTIEIGELYKLALWTTQILQQG